LTDPFLSLIFPAHNEENRLPQTLEGVDAFLQQQSYRAEVLVVENGSTDRTLELAKKYEGKYDYLKVIHEEERGKGLAVKRGMLEATGEYRFFLDVDLSMPIDQVNRFLPPALPNMDIAIASREGEGATRIDEPSYRHWIGRGFNSLVRFLALPDLQDSQCGFKCFRGEIADVLFPKQTIMGWTFDVEILYIARKFGYMIAEIPIPWYYRPNSKVRVWRDSLQMARDLLAIRRNGKSGLYDLTR
jgi:glycosyltransferase involved in cell wall biosynthesis